MKNILFLLFCLTSFAQNIQAEDIVIPVVDKPSMLEEGTSRKLSDEQIEELIPWGNDSKIFLTELLDNLDRLDITTKNDKIIAGIKKVIKDHAPEKSELLMRYALQRGLVIYDILNKESDKDAVGVVDTKFRVLTSTVKMAIKYYAVDIQSLEAKDQVTFAEFGKDYYNFLAELNKSIIDASAQYNIQRTTLEWLQWDLYRDTQNTKYASRIVKINDALKKFPAKKLSDAQSISYLKDMKKLIVELKFKKDESGALRTILPIGDSVIYLGHMGNKFARIEKVSDEDDSYTIRYSNGMFYSNIYLDELALTSGCGPKYCVKDKLIIDRRFEVTIVAVKHDGTYVYRYDDEVINKRAIEATDQAERFMYQ